MAKPIEPTESPIKITSGGSIHFPAAPDMISVSVVDWERCMENIRNLPETDSGIDNTGWAMIGAGASALFSAISLAATVDFSRVENNSEYPNWRGIFFTVAQIVVAILGLACGRVYLMRGKDNRLHQKSYKTRLTSEMDQIHSRCIRQEAATDSATQS